MANAHTLLFSLLAATSLWLGCNAPAAPAPVAPAAPAASSAAAPAASSAAPPAPAEVSTGSAVPESLRPAANEVLVLKASATGTQNYECRVGDGGPPAWALLGPEAQLTDDAGKAVGHHYAGPTWEATDGSKVVGEVKAKANAPDSRSVAWLLLKAKSTSGTGVFSRVTSIQRTETVGGLAPETGCDAQHTGARQASPYRAVYSFYAPRP